MRTELVLSLLFCGSLTVGCGDDGGGTGSSGSGSSGSGDSTAAPMTTTTTTDGTTATPGTTDTTAESTTMEPGTTSGDTTTDPSAGSSDSTGGDGPAYPACMEADPTCPRPYVECYEFGGADHSVCTAPCMQDDDCPMPDSGDATPSCAGMEGDQCLLDCSGGATCPEGMDCVDVANMGMFFRCLWPNA